MFFVWILHRHRLVEFDIYLSMVRASLNHMLASSGTFSSLYRQAESLYHKKLHTTTLRKTWCLEILLEVAVGPMEYKQHGAGSIHNGEMI